MWRKVTWHARSLRTREVHEAVLYSSGMNGVTNRLALRRRRVAAIQV
jgi:hypothetical protein